MKRVIMITPHSVISLLLCAALLLNTSAPALAQIQLTSAQKNYISRRIQATNAHEGTQLATETDSQLERQIHFHKLTEKLSNGELTQPQLTRLTQIKMMFSPSDQEVTPQSAFEKFQTLYNSQIDTEFTREQTAMKQSVALMDEKIKQTAGNYHKDIYTALITNYIPDQVMQTLGITDKTQRKNLFNRISKDLEQLSYEREIHSQITALTQKYPNNSQLAYVLTGIAHATDLREQAVLKWQQQANDNLRTWHQKNEALLRDWKKQARAKARQVFDQEYEPQLLQEKERQVHLAVQDLWAYKDLAPKAAQTLLLLAPSILQLRTIDGESFFNQQQKDWLYQQYLHDLHAGMTCQENTPGQNSCMTALFAITGLSMLTDDRRTAYEIEAFMQAHLKTAYTVPTLLTGTAALLSMKQYNLLDGFLHTATWAESDIKNLDMLSFETLVNMAANKNGHYLGEVSKYAQYPLQDNPTEQTPVANAWEDVAQLLAEEGSPEALALLRKYGVEQCRSFTETSITLKEKQKLVCVGITPFLVGALQSGKSGAPQYKAAGEQTSPGTYLTRQGTAQHVSPEQARQNLHKQEMDTQAFHRYAASMGLAPQAMLARHLFLQTMGDLNPESELRVDTQLYKVYQASNPQPKPGFEIKAYTRNSSTYNAKRVRNDRNHILRKIAHWGDIAFLLWCVYDIGKWVRNGVKISRALIKASSMARNGASVAQRAVMLRRLNIAPQLHTVTRMGSNIKKTLSPTVLAQMPHFTSSTVELPKMEGFVESAGKLVAQNMRFSAQTGLLSADIPALTDAARGVYSAGQIHSFDGLLHTAATSANTQFANRSALTRLFTFNPNASYRSYLAHNLLKLTPVKGLKTADLHNLARQITRSSIRVPQNIASFQEPSFLETVKGVSQLNMGALTRTMARVLGTAPTAKQINRTEELLNSALVNANAQFLNRGWLSRKWNWLRGTDNQKYRNILADNIIAEFDRDGTIFDQPKYYQLHQELVTWVLKDQTLTAPAWATRFRFFDAVSHGGEFRTMGTALLAQEENAVPLKLPLEVKIQLKEPFRGIEGYQRILISKNKKNQEVLLFGFGNDLNNPVNPSQFKLRVEPQDIPALLRASKTYTGKDLEIKLLAPNATSWHSFFNSFRSKQKLFAHEIPVRLRQADGSLFALPVKFKAESSLGLNGATAVLEEGNTLAWYRGRNALKAPDLIFGLPKNQLRPFVGILAQSQLQRPLHLKAMAGKNKIRPLFYATGLSLSSASAGLITPLENVYGDRISESQRNWISLVFPYAPSLFAPFFSGIVLKFGALRTLQGALVASTAGLTVAALNGFHGHLNPSNLPPLWPLYVSGLAIGVSSALSRSGLNLLIDSMGGGGSLLKSMAYKNAGSFLLLLPPFLFNIFEPNVDFTRAFPTLAVLSFASLAYVSSARISTEIGKMPKIINPNFMPFKSLNWNQPLSLPKTVLQNTGTLFSSLWGEAKTTGNLLCTKQVLPLVLAATAFTAFESGAFTRAGNQLIGANLKDVNFSFLPPSNRKNFTNLLTNISVIATPFLMRYYSKPMLKLLATTDASDQYRRMLKLSFALNTAGASILYTNGFDGYFSPGMLGIALMGLGTAQMTQSFQKLSNTSVVNSLYAQKLLKEFSGAQRVAKQQFLVDETMTGFPIQQIGIALLPTVMGAYTDKQIENGLLEKKNATLSSLWMPLSALGLCLGLSAKQIGLFPAHLPAGLVGLTKGVVGSYPGAFKQLPKMDFYLKKPFFGMPDHFLPLSNNPILNVKDIIPSQKDLKRLEKELENKDTQTTQQASPLPNPPAQQTAAGVEPPLETHAL